MYVYSIMAMHHLGYGPLQSANVTARTNASEPKLERMLYYEDTKLRRRRRYRAGRQGTSNKRANSRIGRIWQILAGDAP